MLNRFLFIFIMGVSFVLLIDGLWELKIFLI